MQILLFNFYILQWSVGLKSKLATSLATYQNFSHQDFRIVVGTPFLAFVILVNILALIQGAFVHLTWMYFLW